jgi:hypothetical protein
MVPHVLARAMKGRGEAFHLGRIPKKLPISASLFSLTGTSGSARGQPLGKIAVIAVSGISLIHNKFMLSMRRNRFFKAEIQRQIPTRVFALETSEFSEHGLGCGEGGAGLLCAGASPLDASLSSRSVGIGISSSVISSDRKRRHLDFGGNYWSSDEEMLKGNLLLLLLLLSQPQHQGGGGGGRRGALPAQVVAGVGVAKRCLQHARGLEEEGEGHGHQG